jgi:hypothetical protein
LKVTVIYGRRSRLVWSTERSFPRVVVAKYEHNTPRNKKSYDPDGNGNGNGNADPTITIPLLFFSKKKSRAKNYKKKVQTIGR